MRLFKSFVMIQLHMYSTYNLFVLLPSFDCLAYILLFKLTFLTKDNFLFQIFTVVVSELETGLVVSNATAALSAPSFSLTGLRAEQEYLLAVYASNPKGRSKEVILQAATPKLETAERPTDQGRG